MTIPTLGGGALLSLIAAAAVLAPVRFSTAGAIAPAAAECATCCSQAGTLCVICARTCTTVQNAYDNGTGPCPG